MSVIDDSGVLAIATRLMRLSEQFRKDGHLVYKEYGIDFEPKWFPVIYALHHKTQLSVVELAAEIGYTHPSTISLLKELEKQKWVRSQKDKTDERKRMIRLSEKGRDLVTQMEPVWQVFRDAFADLLDTKHDLMQAIAEVEANFKEKSLYQRALQHRR
ncbi:MAG TPA: MarR family transcriptional regulator [Puia sp.]|jgi:DNA-binding MarR family transcriptional regulator|nr:MarR family transcriptional regulator [Puia sp.]